MTDNRILLPQQPLLPINNQQNNKSQQSTKTSAPDVSFGQILTNQLSGLKFSQHAMQRLQTRNITLNQNDLEKLSGAVDKAAQKGARDSLILMNNLALLVSVKNRTVITAMDGANIKDNVFTNIDSAVIV
jgi:flagellar operon protein